MEYTTLLAVLHAAILAAASGTVVGFLALRRESRPLLAAARGLAALGLVLVLVVLVRRGVLIGAVPLVSRFDSHLAVAALFLLGALAIDVARAMPVLTIAALPLAGTSLIFAAALGLPAAAPPQDAPVRGILSGVHVTVTMLAYAAFGLSFVTSVLYLIEHRQLKARTEPSILGIMPSLETSYRLTRAGLAAGVALLTAGVLLGYQQGRLALTSSSDWRTDPKTVITTLVWAAYVAIAALSFVPALKGRRTALASAICFVLVMAASWATAFWSGFHRHF